MLDYKGTIYRNLEEQVRENQSNIAHILEVNSLLTGSGVLLVGHVSDDSQLPSDYEGNYGDAYAVGDVTPYDLYVWTRPIQGETEAHWFNIGQFPLPGPKGDKGDKGETGPTGPQGPRGMQGLRGATGLIGPTGPQGIQGPQGPTGPQGIQGPIGNPFTIVAELDSISLLPEPEESTRNNAYLVDINGLQHLYVIIGNPPETELEWHDAGQIQGIQGPQGPTGAQGIQGPAGPTGPQGPTGPTGPTGPQGVQGPQGIKGETGPTGPKGKDGTNGVVTSVNGGTSTGQAIYAAKASGTSGQYLKSNGANANPSWETPYFGYSAYAAANAWHVINRGGIYIIATMAAANTLIITDEEQKTSGTGVFNQTVYRGLVVIRAQKVSNQYVYYINYFDSTGYCQVVNRTIITSYGYLYVKSSVYSFIAQLPLK